MTERMGEIFPPLAPNEVAFYDEVRGRWVRMPLVSTIKTTSVAVTLPRIAPEEPS